MARLPGSVLYVCSLNRVRSPMAAGLTRRLYGDAMRVDSCGLQPSDEVDFMAASVMTEIGVDLSAHQPRSLADMPASSFGLIVALSSEAWGAVQVLDRQDGPELAHWPVEDPTVGEGSRETRLETYRKVRRDLETRITQRFGPPAEWE